MAYFDPYYQDPYGGYDPYGAYDPYGYYQNFDDSPPPEPSKDWEDVPKLNRSYVRNIQKDVIQEEFKHLKSENLYGIEATVEYIELNEELTIKQETQEKLDDKIVTSLKMFNLPFSELSISRNEGKHKTVLTERTVSKNTEKPNTVISEQSVSKSIGKQNTVISERSISRNTGKLKTVISERSPTTLPTAHPPISDYFQTMLSHLAKLAHVKEPEVEVEEDVGEEEENEEGGNEMYTTINEKQDEKMEEETSNRAKIDVMEGSSVLVLSTGFSMIQRLQTQDMRIAVGRSDDIDTEEGLVTEIVPLGFAAVRFPQKFHHAVLQRVATESSFSVPLIGDEGEEVGKVELSITFVSLGQGVEVEISEGPKIYRKVKLIDKFTPEAVQAIFDPPVHPRLAVTLLNMEPPLGLNRTSTEIIQNYFDSDLTSSEAEEGYSEYKPRKCRWLELAKQTSLKSSKLSLNSRSSVISSPNKRSLSILKLPVKSDPELDLLWRSLKRQCKEAWDEAEAVENEKRSLYEELEELLRQDKGEGWDKDVLSETSKPPQEEERISKTSEHSDRKSNLSATTTNTPVITTMSPPPGIA